MTTKEIAILTGISKRRINEIVKEKFPEIIINGKKTTLNNNQSKFIISELRKKGFVEQPSDFRQVELQPTRNEEVIKQILEPILKQQNEFNLKLLNEIKRINNQKSIKYSHKVKHLYKLGSSFRNSWTEFCKIYGYDPNINEKPRTNQ